VIPVRIDENGRLSVSQCTCSATAVAGEPPGLGAAAASPTSAVPEVETNASYGQILKSSALVGGSQVLNIVIGIVRTKAMAVLLGPSGFGLFGLYGSIVDLTQNLAGMGVNSSGVRQIAAAVGSGNNERIAQTAAVLRRTSVLLGLLGATLLVVFSGPISRLSFGNMQHGTAIALLSVALFMRLVSGGQGALIQGMRRIGDLAKMNVLAALLGAFASIILVFFFRERGVVPSLISVAAMTLLASWWYSGKSELSFATVSLDDLRGEAWSLLKLGSAFMASGFMTMGVAYVVRVMVLRKVGIDAMGLYQSAWTLGGLYIGFVLQAMGADFYPRLTACADNNTQCNRLVNEQTFVGLLLAAPGIIATLTLAPVVLTVLYAAKFTGAVEVLRWICLGAMLQVVSWPMGFIIIAKGRQGWFFTSELTWTVVAVTLAWACIRAFGLKGAGVAFFGSYVFHTILSYTIARRLSSFHWSNKNLQVGLIQCSLVAITFGSVCLLSAPSALVIGMVALLSSIWQSAQHLSRLTYSFRFASPLNRLLAKWRSPE
jgi:enterobacterial common antigen flippase